MPPEETTVEGLVDLSSPTAPCLQHGPFVVHPSMVRDDLYKTSWAWRPEGQTMTDLDVARTTLRKIAAGEMRFEEESEEFSGVLLRAALEAAQAIVAHYAAGLLETTDDGP